MAEIDCTLVLNIIIVILLIWVAFKVLYSGNNDYNRHKHKKHQHSASCNHGTSDYDYRGGNRSIGSHPDRVVLYFSSSTCGHCKRFNPTWDNFESAVQGQIRTQKIVCDDPSNREVCQWARDNLELGGVPHVVMIDPDTHSKIVFHGQRTVDELIKFATQQ